MVSRFSNFLQRNWLVLLTLLLFVSLGFVVPILFRERNLADRVQKFSLGKAILTLDDYTLRSQLQKFAREEGFHIEFEDVLIEYALVDANLPGFCGRPVVRIGYILSFSLDFLWFLSVPITSSRVFPVGVRCEAG